MDGEFRLWEHSSASHPRVLVDQCHHQKRKEKQIQHMSALTTSAIERCHLDFRIH